MGGDSPVRKALLRMLRRVVGYNEHKWIKHCMFLTLDYCGEPDPDARDKQISIRPYKDNRMSYEG